jgi:hypothetical protein
VTVSLDGDNQSFSVSASDVFGNAAELLVSGVNIDSVAPTVSLSVSPAANAYGWNNGAVTVSAACTDGLSGVESCSEPVVLTGDGDGQVVAGSATDLAGNTASVSTTVNIDVTAPLVVLDAPADGSTVTLANYVAPSCDATDGLSGVDGVCAVTVSDPVEGAGTLTYTATGSATDRAGNVSTVSSTYTVVTDADAPVITATSDREANANGWFDGPVTYSFECTDVSGVGSCPDPVVVSADGENQSFEVTAADVFGNTSSLVVSGVNIDSVDPTVTVTAPLSVNPVGVVTVTCAASDALSGLDTSSCGTVSFPALDLDPGVNVFSFSATDRAGNTTTVSKTITLNVTAASITQLIQTYVGSGPGANGIVNSLSTKLQNGDIASFISQLEAQCCAPVKNKRFTRPQVDTLIALANEL